MTTKTLESILVITFFNDATLLTALQQAQTTSMPTEELINTYYLITTNNGIYDAFGEKLSLEKIRNTISLKHHAVKIADLSDEELIQKYRDGTSAKYSSSAALIKIVSTHSKFNPEQFSVTSCSIFRTEKPTATNILQKNKDNICKLL